MPTKTADSERPQEVFPFMQLPPELRVMVYKFALQDIVDPILSADSGNAEEPKPFHGALAPLYTSRLLRLESCGTMRPIVVVHRGCLSDVLETLVACMEESRLTMPTNSRAHLHDQYYKVERQHKCVAVLSKDMLRVYLSDTEIYQVRDGIPVPVWWETLFQKPTLTRVAEGSSVFADESDILQSISRT
jgi:hypothetical protein